MEKLISLIQRGDTRIFYMINGYVKCKMLDKIMPIITHLGSATFTVGFSLLMIFLGRRSTPNWAWKIAFSLALSHVFIHILKRIINRPRPNKALLNVNTFNLELYSYSFPSGHTTAAFSLATSVALIFPKLSLFLFLTAALVGISRMYVGVHYPTDVFIGGVIGTVSAFYIDRLLF